MAKKKTKGTSKSTEARLAKIAQKLREGIPYDSLMEDLDNTLGLEPSQEQNESLDKDWEDMYRKG
jgi:hypothetical protein